MHILNLKFISKHKLILLLVPVFSLGIFFRCYGLDNIVTWYDEVLTLIHTSGDTFPNAANRARQLAKHSSISCDELLKPYTSNKCSLLEVTKSLSTDHPEHPPGFYQGLYLFGLLTGRDITLLRIFPIIFGVLGIAGLFWFALELFQDKNCALLAAALISFSPYFVCYSQELREYSLFCLLFFLSCASLLRAYRLGGIKNWSLYTAISSISLYCTFLMQLVIFGQLLFIILSILIGRVAGDTRLTFKQTGFQFLAVLIAIIFVSPWYLELINHWDTAQYTVTWLKKPAPLDSIMNAWFCAPLFNWIYHPIFLCHGGNLYFYRPYENAFLVLQVIEIYCCLHMLRKTPAKFGFLFSIFIVFALFFWGQDYIAGGMRSLIARYYLPILALAILPVSYVINDLWNFKHKIFKATAILMCGFLITSQIYCCLENINCRERGFFTYFLLPINSQLQKHEDYVVLFDQEFVNFPNFLSLAYQLPKKRQIAYIRDETCEWINELDHAYLLHDQTGSLNSFVHEYKFKVKRISPFLSIIEKASGT